MAKRKAGVKDIIYELDNDDIEISSDDEVKESKKGRFKVENSKKTYENKIMSDRKCIEVISLDSPDNSFAGNESHNKTNNGGKNCSETTSVKNNSFDTNDSNNVQDRQSESVNTKNSDDDCLNTIIFDEDMVLDSPASNSDYGVVGCENRTPLISVRFNDNNLARAYKKTIKDFIINLLKSRREDKEDECNESDNELEIWPEDLLDEEGNKDAAAENDSLFFVDTEPCEDDRYIEVPKYSQNAPVISNASEEKTPVDACRRRQTCFNCDGDHQLRDCTLPRNHQRIAEKRKNLPPRVGRYHVEDDQKYGHITPGRISSKLRDALGLKRYELPLHIYRMRLLGYPPGWLEEARISHSGITLFDSTGTATLDPDEEEGEVCEPGSKDKFDIKKILDFPGFNVPASSKYVEEGHLLGIPPISEQDSKMIMLQNLAPNAVKAYKRKKLLLFPSSNNNSFQGQAEMELDSGDEMAEFPSNPPLPDDEPPPSVLPPPPPSSPPPTPKSAPGDKEVKSNKQDKTLNRNKKTNNVERSTKSPNNKAGKVKGEEEDTSDIEVIEVLQVNDIPVPEDDLITIDEDYDSPSQLSSGRASPTLDDLEKRKLSLLNALKSAATPDLDSTIDLSKSVESVEVVSDSADTDIDEVTDLAAKGRNDNIKVSESKTVPKDKTTDIENKIANSVEVEITSISSTELVEEVKDNKDDTVTEPSSDTKTSSEIDKKVSEPLDNETNAVEIEPKDVSTPTTSDATEAKTPDVKTGHVKTTLYGTPVINVASSYVKLPSEDKFAKDICDVINFENLPNSTGKFKQISTLLKKVKTVVDRIHES